MDSSANDRKTLVAIFAIYCGAYHGEVDFAGDKRAYVRAKNKSELCDKCKELVDCMMERVQNCPNGHEQNCEDCETKCQRGEDAERIREVMRFAAPRMLARHPIMTLRYLRKKF